MLTTPSTDTKQNKTVTLTASQALVRFLMAQKTELLDGSIESLLGGVWGIFGHGNVVGMGQALYDVRDTLPTFRGQNEQGMAHAAIAYAKAYRCRRAMAVTTSIGPGATNLVTACALAHTNRLPVLFLPGDIFASRLPDPVLQQLEWEHSPLITANSSLEPFSRYYDVIYRPEQLIHALPRAVQTLLDPVRRGPVTLALPMDVQAESYAYPVELFETRIHRIFRPQPDPEQLETCAETLAQAKKPLIIAGGGVHYSGACETLNSFASRHGIPVVETQAGKGTLPHDAPLNLGGIGVMGTAAANAIAAEADVILCVGTRLNDFVTASKSLFRNPKAEFIGLNVSSFDAHKLRALPLICDAKAGIEKLSKELRDHTTLGAYRQRCSREKQQWDAFVVDTTTHNDSAPITDAHALGVVNDIAGTDGIVVAAAGGLPGELQRLWKTSRNDGYHLEYAYSCMGHEIAGGLGVKLANPNREVFVVVGDGSYLMLHTELLTTRVLGLKLNVVVFDNHGFGCINRLQQGCGSASWSNLLIDTSGNPVDIDFAANARSYGVHATKVETIAELRATLAANTNIDKTCVTVIETDHALSTPGSAWWDVPIPAHSESKAVQEAYKNYREHLVNVRKH